MRKSAFFISCWSLLCAGLSLPLSAETFEVDSAASLRAALAAAQANGDSDYILLQPGHYSTEDQGPFLFDSPEGLSLTLLGNEAEPGEVVLEGRENSEVLVLKNGVAGGTFTLKGLTLVSSGQGLATENANTRIEFCAFNAPVLPATTGAEVAAVSGDEMTILSSVFKRGPGVAKDDDDEDSEDDWESGLGGNSRWLLLGTAFTIRNMNIFNDYHAVWAYQEGRWRAYSANPEIRARIAAMNIDELDRIPAYSGFWVWRD